MQNGFTAYNHQVRIGALHLDCMKFSYQVEDTSQVSMRSGRPSGYLQGAVSATGEITLSTQAWHLLQDKATAAGGWDSLPLYEIVVAEKSGAEAGSMTLHGCKLLYPNGAELDFTASEPTEVEHVVKFIVTDRRVSSFAR